MKVRLSSQRRGGQITTLSKPECMLADLTAPRATEYAWYV